MLNRSRIWIGSALALGVISTFSFAQDDAAVLAKGKYIVEEVARCEDCHTPRLLSGELVKSGWLKGTTLEYVPVTEVKNWHQKTPDITSTSPLWGRWGDDGMVAFLETGKNPRGGTAGLPMPPYHMAHEDAVAVVAYLKSLK